MRKIAITAALLLFACGQLQAAGRTTDKRATTYKPRASSDLKYRFDMTPDRSSKDFDAWMKSRGIRVATGKPKAVEKKRR